MSQALRSWGYSIFWSSGNQWCMFIIFFNDFDTQTLTGSWNPQPLIQEIQWTQLNHWHQVTWMTAIQTSGGCTEWWSFRVLCMWYHWMSSCSVGWPLFSRWPYSWAKKLYADQDIMIWTYHEMNTGKWWWNTQVIISLILFHSWGSWIVFRRRSRLWLKKISQLYQLSFCLIKLSSHNSMERWHTLSTSPLVTYRSIFTKNLLN